MTKINVQSGDQDLITPHDVYDLVNERFNEVDKKLDKILEYLFNTAHDDLNELDYDSGLDSLEELQELDDADAPKGVSDLSGLDEAHREEDLAALQQSRGEILTGENVIVVEGTADSPAASSSLPEGDSASDASEPLFNNGRGPLDLEDEDLKPKAPDKRKAY